MSLKWLVLHSQALYCLPEGNLFDLDRGMSDGLLRTL